MAASSVLISGDGVVGMSQRAMRAFPHAKAAILPQRLAGFANALAQALMK